MQNVGAALAAYMSDDSDDEDNEKKNPKFPKVNVSKIFKKILIVASLMGAIALVSLD